MSKETTETKETSSSKYEIVLVFNSDLNEQSLKSEITKVSETIKNNNGSIISEDSWGKRELSYPIQKRSFAHYHLMIFDMSSEGVSLLERQLKISDEVLRHLIVKKDKYAPDGRPSEEEEEPDAAQKTHGAPSHGTAAQSASAPAADAKAPEAPAAA